MAVQAWCSVHPSSNRVTSAHLGMPNHACGRQAVTSNLLLQSAKRSRTGRAVALGNFLAKSGQWKSISLSDQTLSSAQVVTAKARAGTNICLASLQQAACLNPCTFHCETIDYQSPNSCVPNKLGKGSLTKESRSDKQLANANNKLLQLCCYVPPHRWKRSED